MSRPAPPPPIPNQLPEYGRAFARIRGNPSAASVFAPDATVRPVVLGPGLLAEATARDRHAPVMFICGETETAATEDGDLVCKLPPRAFVWLGCSTDGTRSQQICR